MNFYKNNKNYTATNINTLDVIFNKNENSNIRFTISDQKLIKRFLVSSNIKKYISQVIEKTKINRKNTGSNSKVKTLLLVQKKSQLLG